MFARMSRVTTELFGAVDAYLLSQGLDQAFIDATLQPLVAQLRSDTLVPLMKHLYCRCLYADESQLELRRVPGPV